VRPAGGIHILGLYAKPVTFDLSEMVTKGVSMYGIHGRLMYKTWYQMGGLLRSGNLNLRPILTHKFPLDKYAEAMDVMRSGDCGKVAFPMEGQRRPPATRRPGCERSTRAPSRTAPI